MAARRGIALITTLIMLVLVLMVVGAAVVLLGGGSGMAADVRSQTLALRAAEAGVTYAQSRLQATSPGWSWQAGLGTAATLVANTPQLSVVEDQGNAIGVLTNPDGSKSEFLIRFSPQNGTDDPDSTHVILNPHVCVNNLLSATNTPVYLGNGPDWEQTTDFNFECPARQMCLFVEGRAGEGLRDASVDNPYPDAGNRRVVTRLVECHLIKKAGGSESNLTGVLFAGQELSAEVEQPAFDKKGKATGGTLLNSIVKSQKPELFVEGDVNVFDGSKAQSSIITHESVVDSGTVTSGKSVNANLFHTTKNEGKTIPQLPQLDSSHVQSDPAASTLRAGIYMWRDDGAGKKLYYYDHDYDQYLAGSWTPPAPDPADAVNDPLMKAKLGSSLSGANPALQVTDADAKGKGGGTLKVTGNITVELSANLYSSLAIVAEGTSFGDQAADGQKITFEPPISGKGKGKFSEALSITNPLDLTQAPLSQSKYPGGLYLEAKMEGGKGANLVAAGNLKLVGGGAEVNGYTGNAVSVPVNLYSKKNIEVKTKNHSKSAYEPLSLSGLIYSWGDVSIDAGDKEIDILGAVVAYGTDLEPSTATGWGSDTAGDGGLGKIALKGKGARIMYDQGVLGAVKAGANRGPLMRCFWASY